MTTKTYKIEMLVPGQEVMMANCGSTMRVIRRENLPVKGGTPPLYRVSWKGREFVTERTRLAVFCRGRWKFGPYNADIVPTEMAMKSEVKVG